jgi:hypothetical protein
MIKLEFPRAQSRPGMRDERITIRDVVDAALVHVIGDKVEAAYASCGGVGYGLRYEIAITDASALGRRDSARKLGELCT